MALSEEERRARFEEISQLLATKFHVEFQDHYSIAIATCGIHPEQVNNELRNMLTHIARALLTESYDDYLDQIRQAQGHLKTASRDCIKLSNFYILKELKEDSFLIQMRDGTISTPLRMRLLEIESIMKEARRAEVNGSEQTIESLQEVNAGLQEIRKDYAHLLVTPGWTPTKWQAFKIWISKNWEAVCIGVMIGLLTNVIWIAGVDIDGYYFSKHDSAVAADINKPTDAKKVRAPSAMLPSVANNPSIAVKPGDAQRHK